MTLLIPRAYRLGEVVPAKSAWGIYYPKKGEWNLEGGKHNKIDAVFGKRLISIAFGN